MKKAILITTYNYSFLDNKWEKVEELVLEREKLCYEEKAPNFNGHHLQWQSLGDYDVYVAPCTISCADIEDAKKEELIKSKGDYLESLVSAVLKKGNYGMENVYLFAHDKDFILNKESVERLAKEDDIHGDKGACPNLKQLVNENHVWLFYHQMDSSAGAVVSVFKSSSPFKETHCKELIGLIDMFEFFVDVDNNPQYKYEL